ncbi:MAG: glycosyltransferase [Candidatus Omnitrophota bacterium]|jgi:glycosyltransferase involved in cell wall biosynthesis
MNKLSVIIPVYNEKNTIQEIVCRVQAVDIKKEIIIVDDGSTDGTRDILVRMKDNNVKIILKDENEGKGSALRLGFAQASGDIVIVQDADLEYDPQEYHKLIKPIIDGNADVVYGSRFLSTETHRALFFWHMVGNKLLTLLTDMVCNLTLTDMETCYKAFRNDVIRNIVIEEKRFGFEPEITIKISQMNCRIYEVGIAYYGRSYYAGKKVAWRDGVEAIKCIIKYGMLRHFFNQEPFLEKFLRKLRLRKIIPYIKNNQIVCDIGCGSHFMLLRKISNITKECIGIDKKVVSMQYSNLRIQSMRIDNTLPLEEDSVDIVTMLATLEHFENDSEIIKEARRILKPEGLLLITVLSTKAKGILHFLAFGCRLVSRSEILEHKRYYTAASLRELLTKGNLYKIEVNSFEFGFNLFCVASK